MRGPYPDLEVFDAVLTNGWTVAGGLGMKYRRNPYAKLVELSGIIERTNPVQNEAILTLPVGYRITIGQTFKVVSNSPTGFDDIFLGSGNGVLSWTSASVTAYRQIRLQIAYFHA